MKSLKEFTGRKRSIEDAPMTRLRARALLDALHECYDPFDGVLWAEKALPVIEQHLREAIEAAAQVAEAYDPYNHLDGASRRIADAIRRTLLEG
jgi:hypothetical protein